MFSSIRRRLVVWQVVLLTLVIAGFASGMWWQIRRAAFEQLDADLFGAAQSLATQVAEGVPPGNLEIPELYRHRLGMAPHDHPYAIVWNAAGRRLATIGQAPPTEPETRPFPDRGPRPFLSRDRPPLHEVAVALEGGGQVVVGRPMHREMGYLRRVLIGMAVGGLVSLGLGIAGAWLLARRIVEPLEAMTAAAEAISANKLDQRLDVGDPRSETGRLAMVLNAMFDRLQAAFQRQVRFTADASHELRTPVTVVLSHTEFALAKDRSDAEYREALAACQRAAQRMRQLIDGLLTLSRADANAVLPQEAIAWDELVAQAAEFMQPLANERGIAVNLHLQPLVVHGNRDGLLQVVTNLLGNAIAYNRDGGRVSLRLERHEGRGRLTVDDSGLGIPADDLPHVFDRFYRVDKARSGATRGNGLGLAICHEIVQRHGGTIALESKLGEGTRAIVDLPLQA